MPETRRLIVDTCTHVWDNFEQLGELAPRHRRTFSGKPWDRNDPTPESLRSATEHADYVFVHGLVSDLLHANVQADDLTRFTASQPGRFIAIAGIDPMRPRWDRDLAHAVGLGALGVTISPAAQGFHPSHSEAMRLYEQCEAHRLAVFIDQKSSASPRAVMEFAQPYLLDEVARTFPQLRMVIGQMGLPWTDQALHLVLKHEHVYAETSELATRPWQLYQALLTAWQTGAISKLMLGSGFPLCTTDQAIVNLYAVNNLTLGSQLQTIPREQLRHLVERDAITLLGLEDRVQASATTAADDDEEMALDDEAREDDALAAQVQLRRD